MSIALIDADILVYQAMAGQEMEVDWDQTGEPQIISDVNTALEVCRDIINTWMDAAGCKRVRLAFSDRSAPKCTFRYKVHPNYKASRPDTEKPAIFYEIIDKLQATYKSYVYPNLEGDDVLGLLATEPNEGQKMVVCSIDKDIYTIPAKIMRTIGDPQFFGVEKIQVAQADRYWMYQTLIGDSTDGYLGCPGVGDKRANQVLAEAYGKSFSFLWELVLREYEAQYEKKRWREKFVTDDPEEEAIMNARCARILRHGDYDYKKGTINLWTPR